MSDRHRCCDGGANERRTEELAKELERHDRLYHALGTPEISDAEYDALRREYESLTGAPREEVGSPPAPQGTERVQREIAMGSLSNAMNAAELREWLSDTARDAKRANGVDPDFICEPKYDGLALELEYRNGELVQASTRGDGVNGEDVTKHALLVEDVPKFIEAPGTLFVRGEMHCPVSRFDELNDRRKEEGLPVYATPRNFAAGAVMSAQPKPDSVKALSFYGYDLFRLERDENGEAKAVRQQSQTDAIDALSSLGFPTALEWIDLHADADSVEARCAEASETYEGMGFATDGVVVKVNDLGVFEALGERSGGRPAGAVAFKFPPKSSVTKVEEIKFSVGRTGAVTPYAKLTPVQISGVVVSSATLHNGRFLEEMDVRTGDQVEIERAGDVIPAVKSVLKERRNGGETAVSMPAECPGCGSELFRAEEEIKVYCVFAGCPAQALERVNHFVARECMDIRGLGPETVLSMRDTLGLKSPADLYFLTMDDLLKLPRFGERRAKALTSAIDAARDRPLHCLIAGLGIPRVGVNTSKSVAKKVDGVRELAAMSVDDLLSRAGVGQEAALSIERFFNANEELIARLEEGGARMTKRQEEMQIEAAVAEVGGTLRGKRFVVTGTLSETRSRVSARIAACGGETASSVSRKVDFMVAGENPGSKIAKARQYGIPVIDELALERMMAGEDAPSVDDVSPDADGESTDPPPVMGKLL